MKRYLVLIPLVFFACATDTPDVKANARNRAVNQLGTEVVGILGRSATSFLLSVASSELGGAKQDYGQAAAGALWANVNVADTAGAVSRIISAYSGNKAPDTASAAAQVFAQAAANKDPEKVIEAIAAVVSTAAGAPPSKPVQ